MTNLPTQVQEVLPKEHVTWRLRSDTGWHTLLENHWQCSQSFHAQGRSGLARCLVLSVLCELFLFYSLISPRVWAQVGPGNGTQCLLHSQVLSLAPLLPGLTPMGQGQLSARCTSPETRKCQCGPGTTHSIRQTAFHLVSAAAGPCGGG